MEQKFQGFTGETSSFLWDLSFNNERPWFQENRERYQKTLHEPFHALAEDVEREMTQAFPLQNFTVHVSRIYRDARRLFGRGPYKDHLWFTIFNGDNRYSEGPMFWFELSAAQFSYGIGYFDVTPAQMEAFRASVDSNPARFERLASDALRMRGFHVTGQGYRRMKKDLGPTINPFYNRKRFGLEHSGDFDPAHLGPDLVGKLTRAFRRLMPLYDYLYECYKAAPDQDENRLRRFENADDSTSENSGL